MEQKAKEPGIRGVVADIVHVQKDYEVAIETALGGSIQNIVTDNEQTAKRMIGFLKQNRYGRATFLPLSNISGRGGFTQRDALKEPGGTVSSRQGSGGGQYRPCDRDRQEIPPQSPNGHDRR